MTYTRNGLIETVTDGRRITQFEYDERDRLTKRIDPDGTSIAYGYDVAGNRTLVKTALGETRYTFDARNWLDTVIAASGTTDYDYNAVGNLTHTQFGNGTEENRSYDTLNRLKSLENKEADGDLISSYTYTLDKVGNRQSVDENNGRTVNYTYDELYRLTQEQVIDAVNGNRTSGYIYDNVGNRLTKTDSAEGATTYTYDNNDRLLEEKVAGQVKTTYTYDDNGNTLTKTEPGQETHYTWDDQNRLVAADITTATGTKHLAYAYDTSGIRVASKVDGQETRYLIDANQPYAQVLEEYTIDGTVLTAYVYGNDLLSQTQYDPQNHTGSTTYYHVDGLGSTTALTDETGTVVSTSRYDAYGEKTSGTGNVDNKYLFAGEQYDSNLGDYYLRARYYDPENGRFERRDTYKGRLGEPLTLHKYGYTHNNPVNGTDPTGLFTLTEVLSVMLAYEVLQAASPLWSGLFTGAAQNESIGNDRAVINIYPGFPSHIALTIDGRFYSQDGRIDPVEYPTLAGREGSTLSGGAAWFEFDTSEAEWRERLGSTRIERYSIALDASSKQQVVQNLKGMFDQAEPIPQLRDSNHYRLRQYQFMSIFGINCATTTFKALPPFTQFLLYGSNMYSTFSPTHMASALRVQSLNPWSGIKRLRDIAS